MRVRTRAHLLATMPPGDPDFFLCCSAVFPPIPAHDQWKPSPEDFATDGARIEGAFGEHMHRAEAGQDESTVEVYVRDPAAVQPPVACALGQGC